MEVNTFKASVQNGDLKGSSAADTSDLNRIEDYLQDLELLSSNESVFAVKMNVGENHGKHTDPVYVSFFIMPLSGGQTIPEKNADSQAVEVKVVKVDMNITEFLAFFKRFEVAMSSVDDFNGSDYVEI